LLDQLSTRKIRAGIQRQKIQHQKCSTGTLAPEN
jgi:hypothetical protein